MRKKVLFFFISAILSLGALHGAPYIQDRHYLGQDSSFDIILSADSARPETLFDIGIGVPRIAFTAIYGPPSWFVRFRLGAAWAPTPAMSLITGVELPLFQLFSQAFDQPILSLRALADADIPLDGSLATGLDLGMALSVTPSLVGPSLGWRSSLRGGTWSHSLFLAYTGAFYAGKHTREGESP